MQTNILPVGSLVDVISYSPFRGLRGTIEVVNTITDESEQPFCFYLVTLEGAHIQKPIWFEYNEVEAVELVASPLVGLQVNDQRTSREWKWVSDRIGDNLPPFELGI